MYIGIIIDKYITSYKIYERKTHDFSQNANNTRIVINWMKNARHHGSPCIKRTEHVTTNAAGGLVHRGSKRDGFFILIVEYAECHPPVVY